MACGTNLCFSEKIIKDMHSSSCGDILRIGFRFSFVVSEEPSPDDMSHLSVITYESATCKPFPERGTLASEEHG